MTARQYIWIRNIALVIMLCNVLYFYFPFAPIYWRIGMLLLGAYLFFHVYIPKITLFEKLGLLFLAINILYFLFGCIWLPNPTQTTLGNTLFCMTSLFLFCRIGAKGLVTEKFILTAAFFLVVASILRYYNEIDRLRAIYIDRESITINVSTLFVTMLPMALIMRKRIFSIPFVFICISFIISSGKRGNAVAAVIPISLFLLYYFKRYKINFFNIIIIVVASVITFQYAENLIVGSEFLQQRIEMTQEGNSSGRDVIYKVFWNAWYNSDSFAHFMFGYGWDGTIRVAGIRAHNDWLELLVNHGLIGALLYFSLMVSLLWHIVKVKSLRDRLIILAVFSIWITKTFISMGYTEENLALLFISLGFSYSEKCNCNPENKH